MWLGLPGGINGATNGMYDRVIENEMMMAADYNTMMSELTAIPPQMLPPPPPFLPHDRQPPPPTQGRSHLPSTRFNTLPSTRGRRADTNRNAGNSRGRGNRDQQLRSTVNPSKRHRDRLNLELDNLSKLLPFSEDVIARLDKLSILRLSVSYLRNKNFYKVASVQTPKSSSSSKDNDKQATVTNNSSKNEKSKEGKFRKLLNKAIDGFILVVTVDGELFYVSERVKEYLGYSQSQVLHQPFDTLLHDDDKEEVANILKSPPSTQVMEITGGNDPPEFPEYDTNEKDFVVRLKSALNTNTSDLYKPFRICGSIRRLYMDQDINNLKYALFAVCTPARTSCSMLEVRIKTTLFCSKNRIDLSFLDLDARGKEFFGYSKKDIFGRSSYVLVHRQDLQHLRCKHSEIMTCGKTSIGTFRLMSKNDEWAWVCGYARVLYKNGKPDFLVTTNRIMSEEEGQAMLKIRDEADYKSLEKIGLIEPDEPSKALELGFPNRAAAINNTLDILKNEPIPMPLQAFIPPEMPPQYIDEPMDSPKLLNNDLLFPCEEQPMNIQKSSTSTVHSTDNPSGEPLQLPSCGGLPPQPPAKPHSPAGSHVSSEHTVKSRVSGYSSTSIGAHSHHSGSGSGIQDQRVIQEQWSPFHQQNLAAGNTKTSPCQQQQQQVAGLKPVPNNPLAYTHYENNSNAQNFQGFYGNQAQQHMNARDFHTNFRANPFSGMLPPNGRPPAQDIIDVSTYPSIHNLKNEEFEYITSPDQVVGPNITLNSPQYPNLMTDMQHQMNLQTNTKLPSMAQRNFYPPYIDGGGWMQNAGQPAHILSSPVDGTVENASSTQEMLDFLNSHENLQFTWQ